MFDPKALNHLLVLTESLRFLELLFHVSHQLVTELRVRLAFCFLGFVGISGEMPQLTF